MQRTAIIMGAGPAGLTAAYELQQHSDVRPVVLEADNQVGGISKTINYRGNRMDLGGHRFFSKSDWVMQWWQAMLPVAANGHSGPIELAYHGKRTDFQLPLNGSKVANGAGDPDCAMLLRTRLSRIFYRRRFFDYPLKLNVATLRNLGLTYTASIGASYAMSRLSPRSPETTLEDFLVNRFGDKLYRTFFKDYTEKVWGVACSEISAEWGAQRIKGLSITKALAHAVSAPFRKRDDAAQKGTETSLIERFLYPKLGPGQMWEEAARRVTAANGEVHLRHRVVGVHTDNRRIQAVDARDDATGSVRRYTGDYFISTLPVSELASMLKPEDAEVARIAAALPYRDFITAGLLVRRMLPAGSGGAAQPMPPDNWIYIQEPDVKLGRLQVFNNWSPYLVADPNTVWLGLEYFCREGDELWSMADPAFLDFAAEELAKIGLIAVSDVLDGTVVRVPKAYPAYFGEYCGIGKVRAFLDEWSNLFTIGRNGMHRYNNQDHSMLAARAAVECIVSGQVDRSALWRVNAEDEYHETKN